MKYEIRRDPPFYALYVESMVIPGRLNFRRIHFTLRGARKAAQRVAEDRRRAGGSPEIVERGTL